MISYLLRNRVIFIGSRINDEVRSPQNVAFMKPKLQATINVA